MELAAILFMLIGGGALAIFVLIAVAVAKRGEQSGGAPSYRESVAASILYHVASAGGASREEALRDIRRVSGIVAPVTRGIDVVNWAETYSRGSDPEQRAALLECAVRLVAGRGDAVPLRQYAALLDLSFGLGFHTDALAKLRQAYGFDYVDHARAARPAERGLTRERAMPVSRADLLAVLGISGEPTRQELTVTYRRLVSLHHPDRFHAASEDVRQQAARRFIEITRAYEELLPEARD